MPNPVAGFISRVRLYITRRRLVMIGLCLLGVIACGGVAVHLLERGVNPRLASLKNAMLWSATLVAAAGSTDAQPVTEAAIFLRIALRVAGTGFVGLFTAAIATVFLDTLLKQGRGLKPVRFPEHVLILGYNDKAKLIVDEIRRESRTPVTLLADLPERPFEAEEFFFVRGKPYEEEALQKADIAHASSAIILSDVAEGTASDARTVLAALAVETLRPEIYTCVEAISARAVEHLQRAGVDEILPTNAFIGNLLGRASHHRGVIKAVADLVTSDEGAELYTERVPAHLAGQAFGDALEAVSRASGAVLIGFCRGGEVRMSPTRETRLEPGDDLLLVAQDRPVL
ncbi:MAG: NAD-binding protein [Bacillota bacterium]|nr:NAD-binding protein [Bacillota bacterium]